MTYSVKSWGRCAMIGNTISALSIGIGCRWRETVTEIVESHPSPDFELLQHRRCVLSQNCLQVLQDLGMTAGALDKDGGHLKHAGQWRFVTDDGLDIIREGTSYPGCAPAEAAFHIPYGALLRGLRREYLRFGGAIHWGTRAGAPFQMTDGSGFWGLQKEFGAINEIECVIGTSTQHTDCAEHLFGKDAWNSRPMIRFPVTTGWAWIKDFSEAPRIFSNDTDFAIVLGKKSAMHMWRLDPLGYPSAKKRTPTLGVIDEASATPQIVAWRLVSQSVSQQEAENEKKKPAASSSSSSNGMDSATISRMLHPSLRQMFAKSHNVVHDTVALPTASCAIQDNETQSSRVTMAGNSIIPVDLFEFRGDSALVAIEDSAALVRRLFKEKYYRGFVPVDFREHEMDCIARRTKLVQRDLQDAEVFLNAAEQIESTKADKEAQISGGGGGDNNSSSSSSGSEDSDNSSNSSSSSESKMDKKMEGDKKSKNKKQKKAGNDVVDEIGDRTSSKE